MKSSTLVLLLGALFSGCFVPTGEAPVDAGVDAEADSGVPDSATPDAGWLRKDCFAPDSGGRYVLFPIKDVPVGCTHFTGNLASSYLDLPSNVGSLVEIDGDLDIQGSVDKPRDLRGLESLERVRGRVSLSRLPITSTSALAKLRQVGSFHLYLNYQLEEIDLPGLEFIERELSVFDHANLRSLAGLQRLRAVGGEFSIRSNPRLTRSEIDKFTSRVFMDGGVRIQ